LPSYFVTAANVIVFGAFNGLIISIIGESLGATISFIIYRYFLRDRGQKFLVNYNKIKKIINADTGEAMYLVFLFRLFPYMPSGLVTAAAALGKLSVFHFTIASTAGKIPALVLEVLIIKFALTGPVSLILTIISVLAIFGYLKFKK